MARRQTRRGLSAPLLPGSQDGDDFDRFSHTIYDAIFLNDELPQRRKLAHFFSGIGVACELGGGVNDAINKDCGPLRRIARNAAGNGLQLPHRALRPDYFHDFCKVRRR